MVTHRNHFLPGGEGGVWEVSEVELWDDAPFHPRGGLLPFDSHRYPLSGIGKLAAVDERVHEARFFSDVLQREMTFSVVEPKTPSGATSAFVFLHGRGRHHRLLLEVEASRAELLAANMWVILPVGEDGWYINSPVQPAADQVTAGDC